jgi:hypothetical protein
MSRSNVRWGGVVALDSLERSDRTKRYQTVSVVGARSTGKELRVEWDRTMDGWGTLLRVTDPRSGVRGPWPIKVRKSEIANQ